MRVYRGLKLDEEREWRRPPEASRKASSDDVRWHVRPSERPEGWIDPFVSYSRDVSVAMLYAGVGGRMVGLDLEGEDVDDCIDLNQQDTAHKFLSGDDKASVRARMLANRSREVLVPWSIHNRERVVDVQVRWPQLHVDERTACPETVNEFPEHLIVDECQFAMVYITGQDGPAERVREVAHGNKRFLMVWAPLSADRDFKAELSSGSTRVQWLQHVLFPAYQAYHALAAHEQPPAVVYTFEVVKGEQATDRFPPGPEKVFGGVVLLALGQRRRVCTAQLPARRDYFPMIAVDCALGNLEVLDRRPYGCVLLEDRKERVCIRLEVSHTLGEFLAEDTDRHAGYFLLKGCPWGPAVYEVDQFVLGDEDRVAALRDGVQKLTPLELSSLLKIACTSRVKRVVLAQRVLALKMWAILQSDSIPKNDSDSDAFAELGVESNLGHLFAFVQNLVAHDWAKAALNLAQWTLWLGSESTAHVVSWMQWCRAAVEGTEDDRSQLWWDMALSLLDGYHHFDLHDHIVARRCAMACEGMLGRLKITNKSARTVLRVAARSLYERCREGIKQRNSPWRIFATDLKRAAEGAVNDEKNMLGLYSAQMQSWHLWYHEKELVRNAFKTPSNPEVKKNVKKKVDRLVRDAKQWLTELRDDAGQLKPIANQHYVLAQRHIARLYRESGRALRAIELHEKAEAEAVRLHVFVGPKENAEQSFQAANLYRFGAREEREHSDKLKRYAQALARLQACIEHREMLARLPAGLRGGRGTRVQRGSYHQSDHTADDKQLSVALTVQMRILREALAVVVGRNLSQAWIEALSRENVELASLSLEEQLEHAVQLLDRIGKLTNQSKKEMEYLEGDRQQLGNLRSRL